MRSMLKHHYGAVLLVLFFAKILMLSITLAEAVAFGCIAVFTGWQTYLYHLRLHSYHQKQINHIKKEINHLKNISLQVKNLNATIHNVERMTPEPQKKTWSGA